MNLKLSSGYTENKRRVKEESGKRLLDLPLEQGVD